MDFQSRIVGLGKKKASEFHKNPLNPRAHPDMQKDALRQLFGQVGQFDVVIENITTGHLLDGHARVDLALEQGDQSLDYLKVELTHQEELLVLATLDETTGMAETNQDALDLILERLHETGDYADILNTVYPDYAAVTTEADDWLDNYDPDTPPALTRHDVPDAFWPSDNDWEIPVLDLALQANAPDMPFVTWGMGKAARSKKMKGTWGFYTEDYRYAALWADPSPVPNSGCVNAVEPNYSCYGQTPRALALYRIYQKRYIARTWQMFGVRIFVDLNVNDRHFDLNLLGVPTGWKAYATRGYNERTDYIEEQYAMACERAQSDSILFLIYGGGQAVKELAKRLKAVHINESERMDHVRLALMEAQVYETPDRVAE